MEGKTTEKGIYWLVTRPKYGIGRGDPKVQGKMKGIKAKKSPLHASHHVPYL